MSYLFKKNIFSFVFTLLITTSSLFAQDSYFDNPADYWEKDELYQKITKHETDTNMHCIALVNDILKENQKDPDVQTVIEKLEKTYDTEICNTSEYPYFLDRLGRAYSSIGNQEKALLYYYKGLHLAELVKDDVMLNKIKSHIIILFINNEKLMIAEKMCEELLNDNLTLSERILATSIRGMIYQTKGENEKYHNSLLNDLGPLMRQINDEGRLRLFYFNLSSSFYGQKMNDSAMYYLQASKLQESTNMEYRIKALIVSGNINSALGNDEKGFEDYSTAMDYTKENGIKGYLPALYEAIITYYQNKGDYKRALENLREFKTHSDSISNQSIIDLIADKESNRKFRDIKNHAADIDEDRKLLSNTLQQHQMLTIALVIAFCLIVVFVFYLIKQSKLIQENHYYIAKKNQRLIQLLAAQEENQQREIVIDTDAHELIKDISAPIIDEDIKDDVESSVDDAQDEDDKNWNTDIEVAFDQWIKDKNYLQIDINLGTVAVEIGTNRSYLSRMVNHRYQQSFIALVNTLRIEYFLIQLENNPNAHINELVEKSGFKSYSTFSRAFKQYTGLNLNQYTKNMNQKL